MPALGNFFPDDFKSEYSDRNIKPGQVLYLFCDFTIPPKEKYLVVACSETKLLLFVINSNIHPFIANNPDLSRCQVRLSASDYDFLEHDSYVNCAEVIDHFNENDINDQIINDVSRVRGELNETTKKDITRAVRSAKTISGIHKREIINSIS